MTLLDKLVELAKDGYSVKFDSCKIRDGLAIEVSKDIYKMRTTITYDSVEQSVIPIHWRVMNIIDRTVEKLADVVEKNEGGNE